MAKPVKSHGFARKTSQATKWRFFRMLGLCAVIALSYCAAARDLDKP
jgi:hypothetical protein